MSDKRKQVTEAIARQLRIEMAIAQVTGADIARKTHHEQSVIRNYLKGTRDLPTRIFYIIAQEINMDVNRFFQEVSKHLANNDN